MTADYNQLSELGNYLQAIGLLKTELKAIKDKRKFIDIKDKIANYTKYHKSVSTLNYGEAFFPVVIESNLTASVLTIKITESQQKDDVQDERWEKVKDIVFRFLDNYVEKNIKNIVVLDWEEKKYEASIKQLPLTDEPIKLENITHNSLELAMAIALISFIIKKRVGDQYAFTGKLEENLTISSVESIKEKTDILKKERPKVNCFFVPVHVKKNNSIERTAGNLAKVVWSVFPEFDKHLCKVLNETSFKSKVTLKTYFTDITSPRRKRVKVVKFKHPQEMKEVYAKKIYDFIRRNFEEYRHKDGVIISGLKINYALPMLVSLQNVANHIPNFIAGHYGNDQAFVLRTKNSGVADFNEGECIVYKPNKKYD